MLCFLGPIDDGYHLLESLIWSLSPQLSLTEIIEVPSDT